MSCLPPSVFSFSLSWSSLICVVFGQIGTQNRRYHSLPRSVLARSGRRATLTLGVGIIIIIGSRCLVLYHYLPRTDLSQGWCTLKGGQVSIKLIDKSLGLSVHHHHHHPFFYYCVCTEYVERPAGPPPVSPQLSSVPTRLEYAGDINFLHTPPSSLPSTPKGPLSCHLTRFLVSFRRG